jgi:hypothetical protein
LARFFAIRGTELFCRGPPDRVQGIAQSVSVRIPADFFIHRGAGYHAAGQRGPLTNQSDRRGDVFRLRPVVTVGVMMMRFVVNVMVMMTPVVFITATGVPWAAGLCRRKRSGEDDHSECNFQVHGFFLPSYLQRVCIRIRAKLKGVPAR